MIGLATQLAPKSAANNVIRFGLYCFSLNTHGKMMEGTSGVNEKMAGSQNYPELISNSSREPGCLTRVAESSFLIRPNFWRDGSEMVDRAS